MTHGGCPESASRVTQTVEARRAGCFRTALGLLASEMKAHDPAQTGERSSEGEGLEGPLAFTFLSGVPGGLS